MTQSTDRDRKRPVHFSQVSTDAGDKGNPSGMALRYSDAILDYVRAWFGQRSDAAADVHGQVILAMLERKFASVTREKGQFRYYVRKTVRNACLEYERKNAKRDGFLRRLWDHLRGQTAAPAALPAEEEELAIWRRRILKRTQERFMPLWRAKKAKGKLPLKLKDFLRCARGKETSEALAARLCPAAPNAQRVRKLVQRLREEFARLLLEEVRLHLCEPTKANVTEYLAELGLLPYGRRYLERDCG